MKQPRILKETLAGWGDRPWEQEESLRIYNRIMSTSKGQFAYRNLATEIWLSGKTKLETARLMVLFQDALINYAGSPYGAGKRGLFFYQIARMPIEVYQAAVYLFSIFRVEMENR